MTAITWFSVQARVQILKLKLWSYLSYFFFNHFNSGTRRHFQVTVGVMFSVAYPPTELVLSRREQSSRHNNGFVLEHQPPAPPPPTPVPLCLCTRRVLLERDSSPRTSMVSLQVHQRRPFWVRSGLNASEKHVGQPEIHSPPWLLLTLSCLFFFKSSIHGYGGGKNGVENLFSLGKSET